MKKRSKRALFLTLLLTFVVTFAMVTSVSAATAKGPTKMKLKAASTSVLIGKKTTVSVKSVTPAKASKAVTWKSSNKSIATVSKKGVVTGKKAGKVKITATAKYKNANGKKATASVSITVKRPPAASVVLDQTALTLAKEGGAVLAATVEPAAASQDVEWTSSDDSIVTVDASGKVVAGKNVGSAVVTATAKGTSVKAECAVSVEVAKPYENPKQVFVSPEWLKSVIDGDQPGYEQYFLADACWLTEYCSEQHIPTAVHINSDEVEYVDWTPWPNDRVVGNNVDDLWDYNRDGNNYGKITFGDGEGDVPVEEVYNYRPAEQLKVFFKRYGITKDTKVILYGTAANASDTGRVAFCMKNSGVKDVKILDGGIQGWIDRGLPTTTEAVAPVPGGDDFDFGEVESLYRLSIEDCKDKLENDPNFRLVSIRRHSEFNGELCGYAYIENVGEPLGAVWGQNSSEYAVDGWIIPGDTMKQYLADSRVNFDDPEIEISFYCGTGWRATIPFFLAYQEGKEKVTMYDGGWYQWELRWKDNPKEYPRQMIEPEQAAYYSKMTFTKKNVSLAVGETAANPVTLRPAFAQANAKVRYYVDDTSIADVDENGVITAKASGATTLYAEVLGDDGNPVGKRVFSGIIVD